MFRSTVVPALLLALLLVSPTSGWAQCNQPPRTHVDVFNTTGPTVSIFFNALTGNDIDPDGDPLTTFFDGAFPVGSLCGLAPNGFCYQPPAGFKGLIALPMQVSDGCNVVSSEVLVFVK